MKVLINKKDKEDMVKELHLDYPNIPTQILDLSISLSLQETAHKKHKKKNLVDARHLLVPLSETDRKELAAANEEWGNMHQKDVTPVDLIGGMSGYNKDDPDPENPANKKVDYDGIGWITKPDQNGICESELVDKDDPQINKQKPPLKVGVDMKEIKEEKNVKKV